MYFSTIASTTAHPSSPESQVTTRPRRTTGEYGSSAGVREIATRGVALEVASLLRAGPGHDHDVLLVGSHPDRHGVRCAVGQDARQVGDGGAVEQGDEAGVEGGAGGHRAFLSKFLEETQP
jgi:hypothetical protein